ncbi:hypothetical protein KRR38_05625 [Novosphingobium sp. G106]|uniref:hypothetical protein n=1 Tax=Novosphingobium sp. G106 TaxID=2849500 RepID=UPI001C2DAC50|nr:hypothetical protein [Novosphingobium sp. G106]MBV1687166.1 hypothetical protein [Novosphingobium sp. G106]
MVHCATRQRRPVGAETIRNLLLGLDGEGWHPRAEPLRFARIDSGVSRETTHAAIVTAPTPFLAEIGA